MTKYTPTTLYVQVAYNIAQQQNRDVLYSDSAAEFNRWHQGELRRAKAEAWEVCASVAEELIEDGIRPADAEEHLRNPYREDTQ